MRELNKFGLSIKGFPYYGWLIAIHTCISNLAVSMNINLIFYGEDGEVEYGGSKKQKIIPFTTLTILEKFISKMDLRKL